MFRGGVITQDHSRSRFTEQGQKRFSARLNFAQALLGRFQIGRTGEHLQFRNEFFQRRFGLDAGCREAFGFRSLGDPVSSLARVAGGFLHRIFRFTARLGGFALFAELVLNQAVASDEEPFAQRIGVR